MSGFFMDLGVQAYRETNRHGNEFPHVTRQTTPTFGRCLPLWSCGVHQDAAQEIISKAVFSTCPSQYRRFSFEVTRKSRSTLILLTLRQARLVVGCVAQLVERRSLTGELSLPCARSAADG